MTAKYRLMAVALLAATGAAVPAVAGVVVTNVGGAATTYQGSPTIVGNPNPTVATVGDGGGGGTGVATQTAGTTVVVGSGQTFTAPASASAITQVEFRFLGPPGGLGTLHLYRLAPGSDPNTFPLTLSGTGADLFGSGAGLAVTGISNAGANDYTFALNNTGTTDQVQLVAGAAYLVSLTTSDGTGLIYRYGGGDSTYAGGTGVYNGGNAPAGNRDAGFAITTALVPEPVTAALIGLAGLAGLRRTRKA